MKTWKPMAGWYIRGPERMKVKPESLDDIIRNHNDGIVSEWTDRKDDEVSDEHFATKAEAVEEARRLYTEQQQQARADLVTLKDSTFEANGSIYCNREEDLQAWRAEVHAKLEIAEAVLNLLGTAVAA